MAKKAWDEQVKADEEKRKEDERVNEEARRREEEAQRIDAEKRRDEDLRREQQVSYHSIKLVYLNLITIHAVRKIGRKFRRCFCLPFFQANWAKNFDLLRAIAGHGTMTIKFYVEF